MHVVFQLHDVQLYSVSDLTLAVVRMNQKSFYYYVHSQLRREQTFTSLQFKQNTFTRTTIHSNMKDSAHCPFPLRSIHLRTI